MSNHLRLVITTILGIVEGIESYLLFRWKVVSKSDWLVLGEQLIRQNKLLNVENNDSWQSLQSIDFAIILKLCCHQLLFSQGLPLWHILSVDINSKILNLFAELEDLL